MYSGRRIVRDAGLPPDDFERFHDVIDGLRVVKQLSVADIFLANRLLFALMSVTGPRRSGISILGVSFDLGLGDRNQRMPELAYVSADRWPAGSVLPPTGPWRVVPDLVAEIVTDEETPREIEERVGEYRRAGVRLIWEILPEKRRVIVSHGDSVRWTIEGDGELLGLEVLPGFRMAAVDLFAKTR